MDLSKTALILVGYQNDYFAQNGILRSVVEEPGRVDAVLKNTMTLVARLAPTPITMVSTPIVLTPDYRALASPSGILHKIKESGAFAAGSAGAQTVPELLAFGDRIDYVQGKVGFNGFSGTQLDSFLRGKAIEQVLLAGMVTSLCIDSTGRAAYERGYGVTLLSDCTSARTPTEQDYYCSQVFTLYARVMASTDI
ncbi:MAG: cysteine hydrolase [Rhodoferax sp.]|jgi:nicotinamidase-related amidase|uniref:cysteine hydrolase family protein n=1 Tax=Rhodoferax sp. TaxID=50421 RepID=UPI001B64A643|nr:cysteine hydrolase [Rhodoferax sp.]MBP9149295.1 cysteine hydrolase [Rhodoferax sp.]MBP9737075.1 cysteine hydrolase [Rhodoferax sp.]